jgi:hypothetical protein
MTRACIALARPLPDSATHLEWPPILEALRAYARVRLRSIHTLAQTTLMSEALGNGTSRVDADVVRTFRSLGRSPRTPHVWLHAPR